MSATKRTLADEVSSLRALAEQLRADREPTKGLAELELVTAEQTAVTSKLGEVVGRLEARYLECPRPSLTLIQGGRDA